MLRIHHLPEGERTVSDFQVRLDGEETRPWFCRVSAMPYNTVWPGHQRPLDQTEEASFVSFEMDRPVSVSLTASKDFSEAVVRPLSKGMEIETEGREIRFTIKECGYYTVELDGWHNALHLFANPATDFGVDREAPGVLYYGPGVHEIGDLELEDGQTLFVDGGAVLYGSVMAVQKKSIRIVGYGVIDGSREVRTDDTFLITWDMSGPDFCQEEILRKNLEEKKVLHGCVHLYSCTDSEIAGVIARDSSTFSFIVADGERVECRWLKTIGMWRYNSDGIDLFNCRYIRIADCFLRNFDDCIVIKGIKGWDRKNMHHIHVTGCTVWCDWGRGLEFGAETCADEYHDILLEDCDLIHGSFAHIDIQHLDRARIYDVLIKNIRCEYSRYDCPPIYQADMSVSYEDAKLQTGSGQPTCHGDGWGEAWQPRLIDAPIADGPFSDDHILGETYHVRFEDIRILCDADAAIPECRFAGADAGHCNHDIVIENISRNGVRLQPEELVLNIGEFDYNIEVR